MNKKKNTVYHQSTYEHYVIRNVQPKQLNDLFRSLVRLLNERRLVRHCSPINSPTVAEPHALVPAHAVALRAASWWRAQHVCRQLNACNMGGRLDVAKVGTDPVRPRRAWVGQSEL